MPNVSGCFNSHCREYHTGRYPDDEAGQIPMAFVVRRPGSNIDSSQIKTFVAEMVSLSVFHLGIGFLALILLQLSIFNGRAGHRRLLRTRK